MNKRLLGLFFSLISLSVLGSDTKKPVYKKAAQTIRSIAGEIKKKLYPENIFAKDKDGMTSLCRAAYDNDLGRLRYLLEKWDAAQVVNVPDNKGSLPLHWVSAKNYVEMVQLLLDHGADKFITAKNNNGESPLYCAVKGTVCGRMRTNCNFKPNKVKTCELLLLHGAVEDMHTCVGNFVPQVSPLTMAIDSENVLLLGLFLKYVDQLDISEEECSHYLVLAVSVRKIEMLRMLLDSPIVKGININSVMVDLLRIGDSFKHTPLHAAVSAYGDPLCTIEKIKLLLQHGADPNVKMDSVPYFSGYKELNSIALLAFVSRNVDASKWRLHIKPVYKLLVDHGAYLLSRDANDNVPSTYYRDWSTPATPANRQKYIESWNMLWPSNIERIKLYKEGGLSFEQLRPYLSKPENTQSVTLNWMTVEEICIRELKYLMKESSFDPFVFDLKDESGRTIIDIAKKYGYTNLIDYLNNAKKNEEQRQQREREERRNREREREREQWGSSGSSGYSHSGRNSHTPLPKPRVSRKYETKHTTAFHPEVILNEDLDPLYAPHAREILGVSDSATKKEIRKAYLKISLIYHPDKVTPGKIEMATKAFRKISNSYGALTPAKTHSRL